MANMSGDYCLEDNREDYQNCSVLYLLSTSVVQSHKHTHEQILQVY